MSQPNYIQRVPPLPQRQGLRYLITNRVDIEAAGIRMHICVSCRMSKLYDKNNKAYPVDNLMSAPEQIEALVEQIKKVNNDV